MPEEFYSPDVPKEAKDYYLEAVAIVQEDIALRRTLRATDAVIANLKKATAAYARFFEAWRLLGEIHMGTEQTLHGYIALKRAGQIKPDDAGVATLLAEGALILNRPRLALDYLDIALNSEKVPLAAKKLRALALFKAERWDDSLKAFGDALSEDPSDGEIRRKCAELLSLLDFHKAAVSVLADYLDPYRDYLGNQESIQDTDWILKPHKVLDQLSPGASRTMDKREITPAMEDYRAWYAMGNIFLDSEQYEAAVACFKKALRTHPDYYDCLHNMGLALQELERLDEALQMYEAAIEVNPEEPDAYMSMAEILEEISPDETDDIAVNYLMHYRLDPDAEGFAEIEPSILAMLGDSPDVAQLLLLAHVYIEKGEFDKAREVIRNLESEGNEEATLYFLKGRILHETGLLDEAETALRAALENLDADEGGELFEEEDIEPKIRYELATVLDQKGSRDEAIRVLTEIVDDLDPDGLSLLAELVSEKDPELAKKYWEKALETDPEHLDSLAGLADKFIELKDIESAVIMLERIYGVDPDDEDAVRKLGELYPQIGADELVP